MPPTDAKKPPSAVTRVVYMAQYRPDLDVVGCTLAKTMAHPKIADEWLVKRVCRKIKGRPRCAPRSWWCRQTVIGHRASPLADLMLEAGCFEVATFFITGVEFKPVSLSALVRANPMSARVAELEVFDGRAPTCRVPHAEVRCRSEFNCTQRYHASLRSWSTLTLGNANNVGQTNSLT